MDTFGIWLNLTPFGIKRDCGDIDQTECLTEQHEEFIPRLLVFIVLRAGVCYVFANL